MIFRAAVFLALSLTLGACLPRLGGVESTAAPGSSGGPPLEYVSVSPDAAPVPVSEVTIYTQPGLEEQPLPSGIVVYRWDFDPQFAERITTAPGYPTAADPHRILGYFGVDGATEEAVHAEAVRIAASHGARAVLRSWVSGTGRSHGTPQRYVFFAVYLSQNFPTLEEASAALEIPDGYALRSRTQASDINERHVAQFQGQRGQCYAVAVILAEETQAPSGGLIWGQPWGFFAREGEVDSGRFIVANERASFRRLGCVVQGKRFEIPFSPQSSRTAPGHGPYEVRVYSRRASPEAMETYERAFALDRCNHCAGQRQCLRRYRLNASRCSVARHGRR